MIRMAGGGGVLSLVPLVGRVTGLQTGERVEVVEAGVGSLYLGTTLGRLLHYGLEERGGGTELSAQLLAAVEVGCPTNSRLLVVVKYFLIPVYWIWLTV